MRIVTTKAELRTALHEARADGRTVGLVPTMGYLHEGHLSLVQAARRDNDVVVVSVFVNPTQFGPGEDYDSYPRDLARDAALVEGAGADVVFAPSPEEMYPAPQVAYVVVDGPMTQGLCGRSRPGHFRGVATVVTKLFNLVRPDRAYFGQKDAQQLAVVRRMVADLDLGVEVVGCPIVREPDGLAMSSRNTYLTADQRRDALVLHRSLEWARQQVADGERDAHALTDGIRRVLAEVPSARVDYVEVVDADTLQPLEVLAGRVLVALAVQVGKPRLIDNLVLEVS